MVRRRVIAITPQFGVALHLPSREYRLGRQMIFEMGFAECALRGSGCRGGRFEAFRRHGATGELPVQVRFLLNEF